MQTLKPSKLAWLLAVGLSMGSLSAQTNVVSPGGGTTDASAVDAKEPASRIVSSDQVDQELEPEGDNLLDSLRAARADYPKLSPEVRLKLWQFKRQRDLYLREQEELLKRLRGSTDAERERVRQLLRERRLEWQERSRSYRESAQERLRDLLRELPKYQEAFEAAREDAQEQAREIRTRPRSD